MTTISVEQPVAVVDNTKTKKIKRPPIDKKTLWDNFDIIVSSKVVPAVKIECIYRASGEHEKCECCGYSLSITDEGFYACSNLACGVIYTDILDQSPEWRYYGADDNQTGDPTRCGMPINPLLQESSFGCKVICPSKCSYEMRKIRRYTEWQSMPYTEKTRYDDFQRITVLANQAGIPKLIIDELSHENIGVRVISRFKPRRHYRRDNICRRPSE